MREHRMIKNSTLDVAGHRGEAGFTLVETLVAIVVLVFGLMAVTNLLLVAANSNQVGNQATVAATSATQVMDVLKSTTWNSLVPGGSLTADATAPSPACGALVNPVAGIYNCDDIINGVGRIKTRWTIAAVPGTQRLLLITVRSEGTSVLGAGRTTATFTAFRACTESVAQSCPLTGILPQLSCCSQNF